MSLNTFNNRTGANGGVSLIAYGYQSHKHTLCKYCASLQLQGKLYMSAFVMGPMLLTGTLIGSWADEELQYEGGILQCM